MRKCAERPHHQIIEGVIDPGCELAQCINAILLGNTRGQHIAIIDKGEQRLQLVIAILAPLADMQREVDLGIGGFGNGHAANHIFG